MPDVNMALARELAEALGPAPPLPASLEDIAARARFLDSVDGPLVYGTSPEECALYIARRLKEIAASSGQYMPDIADAPVRINITLRLWAGCLSAAKTIAAETMDGPNSPETRGLLFSKVIDPTAAMDPIYRAGVEAAPSFKRIRKQEFSLEGVPAESPVRRYA